MPASKKKTVELSELFSSFEKLEDPRASINRVHFLISIVSIAVLAVLYGADGPAK